MNTRFSILLVAMVLLTIPASAQLYTEQRMIENDEGAWSGGATYDNGQYMDNPCTAIQDLVWVNYSAYVDGAQAEAGLHQYRFSEGTTMDGAYAASGTSFSDVGYAAPVSLRKYHKVNTADQFHVVTVIYFDPGAQTTSLSIETACGNGMPDSQE